jgi:hypothetical protein
MMPSFNRNQLFGAVLYGKNLAGFLPRYNLRQILNCGFGFSGMPTFEQWMPC